MFGQLLLLGGLIVSVIAEADSHSYKNTVQPT